MRNTPLATVRARVKAETSQSLQSTSTARDAEINQIIYDTQAWLGGAYDWPFLKGRWDTFLTPSTRFQLFPTKFSPQGGAATTDGVINFERPVLVMTKWNMIWQYVVYGIDEYPEMNYLDPDRMQVLDPAQRWQFSDETQFEIWPLPASNAQIRFIGQRALTELQAVPATLPITWNDTATLDLDDLLVTFFAAAEYLTRQENPRAKMVIEKAQRRLTSLRGSYPVRTETTCIGRGNLPFDRKAIRQVPLVMLGGGGGGASSGGGVTISGSGGVVGSG